MLTDVERAEAALLILCLKALAECNRVRASIGLPPAPAPVLSDRQIRLLRRVVARPEKG